MKRHCGNTTRASARLAEATIDFALPDRDRVTEDFFPKLSQKRWLLLKMAARRDGDIRIHNGPAGVAMGEINSV